MNIVGISTYYKIYQKDGDRRFYLEMPDKTIELRFCELLEFRGKIQAIDLTPHFDSSQNGLEIISFCGGKYLCIFTTAQIIDLQKLLYSIFEGISEKEIFTKYVLL
ncbi:MAG: hypothetical protein Q3983_02385 [Capnocytophaga sp.]|nr:hypothetical protein [Capnocytophaga sp.]